MLRIINTFCCSHRLYIFVLLLYLGIFCLGVTLFLLILSTRFCEFAFLYFWLESVFLLDYFSGFFLFVIFLVVMSYCTFRRISLLSFCIFFGSRLIPTLFLLWVECISRGPFRLIFIFCFIPCWLLSFYCLVSYLFVYLFIFTGFVVF